MKFESTVFGSFGASVAIAPNKINFETVFDDIGEKVKDNVHVIATITAIILLYLFALPFLRRKDLRYQRKVSICPKAFL